MRREKDAKLILVLTSAKIEFFGRENFAKLALFFAKFESHEY